MAGFLIYNGFWNREGPPPVVRSLTAALAARGADWTPLPNTALTADFPCGGPARPRRDRRGGSGAVLG